ncbi:hypothetical protein CONPUDRAFT_164610 [Coniophora puteana RWD-64-598 SS2]|uniref:Uncharacterized protein n=1 Tax=Coniophora puteana (strain RWD-64-598) TaxID=741705 RepID=A0A5M3MS08_CONPW|nr:uncharacterized protein CONPUDRAFT_164610 [Coniophora puteana RWD-64-598 SS2]EIW81876.1 hypothetical protein CONPUDRAFT_164610 [Coniophora puteana RWD-64-598 SS2]
MSVYGRATHSSFSAPRPFSLGSGSPTSAGSGSLSFIPPRQLLGAVPCETERARSISRATDRSISSGFMSADSYMVTQLHEEVGVLREEISRLSRERDEAGTESRTLRECYGALVQKISSKLSDITPTYGENIDVGIFYEAPSPEFKRQHHGVHWWEQDTFVAWDKSSDKQLEKDRGTLGYLEKSNGEPLTHDESKRLRDQVRSFWHGLAEQKKLSLKWAQTSLHGLYLTAKFLRDNYEVFRLCDYNWKVEHFCTTEFPEYRRWHLDDEGNRKHKESSNATPVEQSESAKRPKVSIQEQRQCHSALTKEEMADLYLMDQTPACEALHGHAVSIDAKATSSASPHPASASHASPLSAPMASGSQPIALAPTQSLANIPQGVALPGDPTVHPTHAGSHHQVLPPPPPPPTGPADTSRHASTAPAQGVALPGDSTVQPATHAGSHYQVLPAPTPSPTGPADMSRPTSTAPAQGVTPPGASTVPTMHAGFYHQVHTALTQSPAALVDMIHNASTARPQHPIGPPMGSLFSSLPGMYAPAFSYGALGSSVGPSQYPGAYYGSHQQVLTPMAHLAPCETPRAMSIAPSSTPAPSQAPWARPTPEKHVGTDAVATPPTPTDAAPMGPPQAPTSSSTTGSGTGARNALRSLRSRNMETTTSVPIKKGYRPGPKLNGRTLAGWRWTTRQDQSKVDKTDFANWYEKFLTEEQRRASKYDEEVQRLMREEPSRRSLKDVAIGDLY